MSQSRDYMYLSLPRRATTTFHTLANLILQSTTSSCPHRFERDARAA